jgi:Uma2 family endonuclease
VLHRQIARDTLATVKLSDAFEQFLFEILHRGNNSGVRLTIMSEDLRYIFEMPFPVDRNSDRLTRMSTATLEKSLSYEEERGKPRPSFNHGAVQATLIVQLSRNPQFRVVSELTIEFEGKNDTPDLSIYPRQAINFRHDDIRRNDPPLLVVEIFSPTQGAQEILDKVDVYFRNGVKSCWIVSPSFRTITILTPDGKEQSHTAGTAVDPATGLTADLAAVFS